MTYLGILLLVSALLVLLLAAWRRGMRTNSGKTPAHPEEGGVHLPSYHAVELRATSERGCAEVRALKGRRFLSAEAPPLPLPNCGRSACSCVYVHFSDRRVRQRRHVHVTPVRGDEQAGSERRIRVGRRASDVILLS